MTAQEIALYGLLPLISVRSLTASANPLNDVNIATGDAEQCAIAITQALQEIAGLGPTALWEQRLSMTLRPPTNVSFMATQYSTTISAFTTWASWMEGCTIQGGDGEDNELISATELLRPYQAASGTANCTVYGDAIKLPSYVKNTMDPVETPLIRPLQAATNRDEFRFWNSPYQGDPNNRRFAGGWHYNNRNKTPGDPCVYFVESRYDPTTSELPLLLRVNPMPAVATPITLRVKREPPTVTANDITGSAQLTITGTLSPNAAGSDYAVIATGFNGSPIWQGGPIATHFLFNNGAGQFVLQATAGGLAQQVNCWSLTTASTSPAGTYTANGANTGSPIVTATGTLNLVLPTKWHQSILLPIAKKWFMSHPAFNNASAAANIMEGYRMAKQTLESFIPQITPTQGHYH